MPKILCITFRFIQPFPLFHGCGEGGNPEWPPSPMRAFQALVNAATMRCRGRPLEKEVRAALDVIESVRPCIIAPLAQTTTVGHRAYVPHNQADLVSMAWDRGNSEVSIASHRMEKDYRPTRIEVTGDQLPAVHYLFALDWSIEACQQLLDSIRPSIRSVSALGWGIDQVAADATLLTQSDSASIAGQRWNPAERGSCRLRVQRKGSFDALAARHGKFLNRVLQGNFTPVPSNTSFDIVAYRRDNEPTPRPFAIFELRNRDASRFRYPLSKLIHISGMVRHLTIEAMKKFPPPGVDEDWVNTYIAGHVKRGASGHHQLSYLPLPSVGHEHTDPGIRRVMIAAPIGDDRLLDHVVRRLGGQPLQPLGDEFLGREPPILVPVKHDNIARFYTDSTKVWHSFTPVILPGHDDHNPGKRRSLIEKALRQAGIDQYCEFEETEFSWFRKSYSAHKYDGNGRPQGYIRPNYLLSQTAVHLALRFQEDIPGPIAIGAGRHCGLGLFAPALHD